MQKQLYKYITKSSNDIPSGIKPSVNLSIDDSLGIYRLGYELRLIDALKENYEGVFKFLGVEAFTEHCRHFISKQDSNSWSLGHYHPRFISYLHESNLLTPFPFIVELAELDKMSMELFSRQDVQGDNFSSEDLQEGFFDLQIDFVDSVFFMQSKFPLVEIYEAAKNGLAFEGHHRATLCLLYKDNYIVRMRSFSEQTASLIENLKNHSISESLERTTLDRPEDVQALFEFLFSQKLIKKKIANP